MTSDLKKLGTTFYATAPIGYTNDGKDILCLAKFRYENLRGIPGVYEYYEHIANAPVQMTPEEEVERMDTTNRMYEKAKENMMFVRPKLVSISILNRPETSAAGIDILTGHELAAINKLMEDHSFAPSLYFGSVDCKTILGFDNWLQVCAWFDDYLENE